MYIKTRILLSVFAILITSFTTTTTYASSVKLGVEFGIRLEGGGDCVGKGVCDCKAMGVGTNVTFYVSQQNSNVLVMTFSLTDLKMNQPDQVAYFTSAAGSYNFDAAYSLDNSLFSDLNLPYGATLTPSGNSTVVVNGDVVTVYLTMSFGS